MEDADFFSIETADEWAPLIGLVELLAEELITNTGESVIIIGIFESPFLVFWIAIFAIFGIAPFL